MPLLDNISPPAGDAPDWVAARRDVARAALSRDGLPTKRSEAWRFTNVNTVSALHPGHTATEADAAAHTELVMRFADAGAVVIPVIDGVPSALDADAGARDGVTVRAFTDDDAPYAELPESREEHFRALNTLRSTGFVVDIAPRTKLGAPLLIAYGSTDQTVSHPRVLVRVGDGAEVQLIERFDMGAAASGDALVNAVTDIHLGQNAGLDHTRVHQVGRHLVTDISARLGRDARYQSRVVTLGGPLVRLGLRVRFEGSGAIANLDGAYHVAGKDHIDHHTVVEHLVPHTTSHESYRGVLDERGSAVFDGIAVVTREAPGTEAHQQNRNLLLSDTAVAYTKPHLEIDTDDVVASHGATVGSLDEDQLFYLRARGIPLEVARAMLTFAFVRELLDAIPHAPTREEMIQAFLARLPHGEHVDAGESDAWDDDGDAA